MPPQIKWQDIAPGAKALLQEQAQTPEEQQRVAGMPEFQALQEALDTIPEMQQVTPYIEGWDRGGFGNFLSGMGSGATAGVSDAYGYWKPPLSDDLSQQLPYWGGQAVGAIPWLLAGPMGGARAGLSLGAKAGLASLGAGAQSAGVTYNQAPDLAAQRGVTLSEADRVGNAGSMGFLNAAFGGVSALPLGTTAAKRVLIDAALGAGQQGGVSALDQHHKYGQINSAQTAAEAGIGGLLGGAISKKLQKYIPATDPNPIPAPLKTSGLPAREDVSVDPFAAPESDLSQGILEAIAQVRAAKRGFDEGALQKEPVQGIRTKDGKTLRITGKSGKLLQGIGEDREIYDIPEVALNEADQLYQMEPGHADVRIPAGMQRLRRSLKLASGERAVAQGEGMALVEAADGTTYRVPRESLPEFAAMDARVQAQKSQRIDAAKSSPPKSILGKPQTPGALLEEVDALLQAIQQRRDLIEQANPLGRPVNQAQQPLPPNVVRGGFAQANVPDVPGQAPLFDWRDPLAMLNIAGGRK